MKSPLSIPGLFSRGFFANSNGKYIIDCLKRSLYKAAGGSHIAATRLILNYLYFTNKSQYYLLTHQQLIAL